MESSRCPFFSADDVGAKLAVLEAVLEVGVNFAAVWLAINKKVGDGGKTGGVVGGRHDSQSCARVHDVSHMLLTRAVKGRSDRSTMVSS